MKAALTASARWVGCLTVAILIMAGGAQAELKISGAMAVGVGNAVLGSAGTAGSDGVGEGSVTFEATQGDFTAKMEIGIADTAEALDTAEHELKWSATKNFAIIMSGHAFGTDSTDGNIGVTNAPDGPAGNMEVNLDFSDAGLINIEYGQFSRL